MSEELLKELRYNVIQGRRTEEDEGLDEEASGPGVKELTEQALDEKIELEKIIETLTDGMNEVGEKYEAGEYFITDMLATAETVSLAMQVLKPHIVKSGIPKSGKILLATVEGDIHEIGKNIVSMFLQGNGFEVVDLGIKVSAATIAEKVKEEKPQVVGLSALLTTTMPKMAEVIQALKGKVKVIVGGAPVNQGFADSIGADAYGKTAVEGVKKIKALINS